MFWRYGPGCPRVLHRCGRSRRGHPEATGLLVHRPGAPRLRGPDATKPGQDRFPGRPALGRPGARRLPAAGLAGPRNDPRVAAVGAAPPGPGQPAACDQTAAAGAVTRAAATTAGRRAGLDPALVGVA